MYMASVILPTVRWTPACTELTTQLTPTDELILVCDTPAQAGLLADHPAATPPNIRIIAAGDPTKCSGKCNALAVGLDAAAPTHDIIICTDNDFTHDDGWLARVKCRVREDGAISTLPMFTADAWPGKLIEAPTLLATTTALVSDGLVWGGLMAFHRNQLDLDAVTADLRRTVSDDIILAQHLDDVTTVFSLRREVQVPGTLTSIRHRTIRFVRSLWYWAPATLLGTVVFLGVLLTALATAPIVTGIGITAAAGMSYVVFGVRRWTFVLAVPGSFVVPICIVYGLTRSTFTWCGRTYQWPAPYDVTVLSEADPDVTQQELPVQVDD